MMGKVNNAPNIGWLFYKEYYQINKKEQNWINEVVKYEKVDCKVENNRMVKNEIEHFFKKKNDRILNIVPPDKDLPWEIPVPKSFSLETIYPGLLAGTGVFHSTELPGELKMGFQLDYTTGIPYIPGSSVKGVLRSAFPHSWKPKNEKEEHAKFDAYSKERTNYICSLFRNLRTNSGEVNINLKAGDVEALEYAIFEGLYAGGSVSTYSRCIFFDAMISAIKKRKEMNSERKRLFDYDYITPHENPLLSPKPIQFLKVAPGVVFDFRFRFPETIVLLDGKAYPSVPDTLEKGGSVQISPEILTGLFKQILLDIGIGAKTNVGYGQFICVSEINP